MDGLLILDKPQGMTSHDVVARVRRICKTRRVGHAGTLDPMATGLLLVAVGEGTRLIQFLVPGNKTYRATLKLGEITDTQDREGTVLESRPLGAVTCEGVRKTFSGFLGEIEQIPPMYSAIKKDGVSLHRLARRGIEVEREPRSVQISRLDILSCELPYVTFEVECSKGTYIRTLAHDIGLSVGCGASLHALRRIRSGSFSIDESLSLDSLLNSDPSMAILPMEDVLRDTVSLELTSEAAARLKNGVPPTLEGIVGKTHLSEGERVVLFFSGQIGAVGYFAPMRLKEKRGDFELACVFPDRLMP